MTDLVRGDRVQHKQCPLWHGESIRYGRVWDLTSERRGMLRRVYWTLLTDPKRPKVDWTWEDCIERILGWSALIQ